MATQTRSQATDAVQMLKDDHEKVKGLFRQFEEAGEKAYKTKLSIAEKVFHELEIHSRLEEEVFYPAARAAAEEEVGEVVAEGLEEHHVVDLLIAELKQLSPEEEAFEAKFKVLMENVEHHIQEEEEELLPEAQKALRGQEETLGQEMLVLKKQLAGAA